MSAPASVCTYSSPMACFPGCIIGGRAAGPDDVAGAGRGGAGACVMPDPEA